MAICREFQNSVALCISIEHPQVRIQGKRSPHLLYAANIIFGYEIASREILLIVIVCHC